MGKQQTRLLKQPHFYSACQLINKPNPNSQQPPQEPPQLNGDRFKADETGASVAPG